MVSAQNGLNEQVIARCIGRERTIGCFVNSGADYLEPGVVLYGGRGAVVLGELDGGSSERLAGLHQLFRTFDADAIATPNIWGYLWAKLIYGALLFATALTDDSIADVLANARMRPVSNTRICTSTGRCHVLLTGRMRSFASTSAMLSSVSAVAKSRRAVDHLAPEIAPDVVGMDGFRVKSEHAGEGRAMRGVSCRRVRR